MNAFHISFVSLITLWLAYRFYSKYLSKRVFNQELKDEELPAYKSFDGVDYVPTKRSVLVGHHFSSIAGAAPILGPAIAIIWGWVPALIWIVFGSIFIGAVHDYGALVLSVLKGGDTIGSITGKIIGERARKLFMVIIFLLVFIVIAVFAYIIATLFVLYPGSVIPINFEILVAILIGRIASKQKISLFLPSVIALISLYVMIYAGNLYPIAIDPTLAIMGSPVLTWVILLLIYGYFAAVLPVTFLLQPRDLINAHQLILGLIIIYFGMFLAKPVIVAPEFNFNEDDVSWFPYLFITIACGAVSGFHGLVSSGTTSKQVGSFKDTRSIGYGSMLGEATLAIAATMAVASGFDSKDEWLSHYSSFATAGGLQDKLAAFVGGTSDFALPLIDWMGFPEGDAQSLAAVFISVLVISFAATSLDTSVRIQRYVIGEVLKPMSQRIGENRYFTTMIAVACSMFLVISDGSGSGGLILWPLFGTTNQLLAALTLMVITVFLYVNGRKYLITLIPLLVLLAIVSLASFYNLMIYFDQDNFLLAGIDLMILTCYLWLLIEGLSMFRSANRNPHL